MKNIYESERIIIRKFVRGDGKAIAENANDKVIYKNTLAMPYPYTIKDSKKWIEHCGQSYKKKNPEGIGFAIVINNKVVGGVGIHKIIKNHKAEIGYWLGNEYRGKGVMTEAAKAISNYAFDKYKLKRLWAHTFIFNKGSARVLEKAGFKLEGLLKKEVLKDGKYIDVYSWAKIK